MFEGRSALGAARSKGARTHRVAEIWRRTGGEPRLTRDSVGRPGYSTGFDPREVQPPELGGVRTWAAGARAACAPHAARELPKPLAAAPPAAMDDEMEMEGAEYGGEEPQLEEVRARARARARARGRAAAAGIAGRGAPGGSSHAVARPAPARRNPRNLPHRKPRSRSIGAHRCAHTRARAPAPHLRARVSAAHSALSERARLLTGGACVARA